MGRRKEKAVKVTILIFALFFIQNFSYAQTKISGLVTDGNNAPLYSASVILKNGTNASILSYTYSDNKGNYTLKTGKLNLTFSSLGFESKTIALEIDVTKKEIKIDAISNRTLLFW